MRIKPAEIPLVESSDEITITARMKGPDDLMRLALLVDALRGINPDARYVLGLPYLPYGRADRRFVTGDCAGLAVFAGIINGLLFGRVATLDAHSGKAVGQINNLTDVSAWPIIVRAIGQFAQLHECASLNVLFPDDGARARYDLPSSVRCNSGSIVLHQMNCEKKRDPASGALSGFVVPSAEQLDGLPTLIIDDICDGGGTFLGIADAIGAGRVPLGLYVTHGIFSKGIHVLGSRFSRIFTTDSIENNYLERDVRTYSCGKVLYSNANDLIKEGATK